jgi:hypothetical protein
MRGQRRCPTAIRRSPGEGEASTGGHVPATRSASPGRGWFGLLVNLVPWAAAVLFIGVRGVHARGRHPGRAPGDRLLAALYSARTTARGGVVQTSLPAPACRSRRAGRPSAARALSGRGRLEFDHVSSRTTAGGTCWTTSLRVEPGMRVGIKGLTGAGKTSLVASDRFYDPTAGRSASTHRLRDYRLRDLWGQVSWPSGPGALLPSIAENIRWPGRTPHRGGRPPPSRPTRTPSVSPSDTTPPWVNAACGSPAANGSASRSPARS